MLLCWVSSAFHDLGWCDFGAVSLTGVILVCSVLLVLCMPDRVAFSPLQMKHLFDSESKVI